MVGRAGGGGGGQGRRTFGVEAGMYPRFLSSDFRTFSLIICLGFSLWVEVRGGVYRRRGLFSFFSILRKHQGYGAAAGVFPRSRPWGLQRVHSPGRSPLDDHGPQHPYTAGTKNASFSPTRPTLHKPSAKHRKVTT